MTSRSNSTNTFYKICKSAMAEKKLIAVFTDETTTCSVGTVDFVTPEEVRLATLSRLGAEAGYDVIRISKIHRIETDSNYEKKVECLHHGFNPQDYSVSFSPPRKATPLIPYTLKQAIESKTVVSLYSVENNILTTGFVVQVDSDSVTIRVIDEFGHDDGICTLLLENVHAIDCNSTEDRTLAYLNQQRGK